MANFRGHNVYLGADLSAYDPNVNFPAFRNGGYSFAIIKSTEGTSSKSPAWGSYGYPAKARAAGVTYGAYHYAHPGDGAAQARFMLAVTGRHSGDMLRPTLDIEGDGWNSSNAPSFTRAFSAEIKRQLGVTPIVYCSASFWKSELRGGSGWRTDEPLWVAHYTSASSPAVSGWDIWQHSSTWPVPGNRNADANVMRMASLPKLLVGGKSSAPVYRTQYGLDTTFAYDKNGHWLGRSPVYGLPHRPYVIPGFSVDARRLPANAFPLLRKGSTGPLAGVVNFVRDLLLVAPGYADIPGLKNTNGYYGQALADAVYRWQTTHGLGTNGGAMTEATWASLLGQVKV